MPTGEVWALARYGQVIVVDDHDMIKVADDIVSEHVQS